MGSSHSRRELLTHESVLLRSTGIPEDAVSVRDVYLDDPDGRQGVPVDPENYIHEMRIKGKGENLPKMLMLHGFMAGGAYFYKMFPFLWEKFDLIAIDTLGQGCSGRPQLSPDVFSDHASTVNFFVKSLERYLAVSSVVAPGEKFYLVAHSMGSIIASHFTLANPG